MNDERPPLALFVSAVTRSAARDGVPVTVTHRGDPNSGTMILKINLLNGTARVLTEIRCDDERVWAPATNEDPMPEAAAEAYLARQAGIDPDVWLIEIEDKKGRLWFPGKVMDDKNSSH
jgi:hypothetical protein